MHKEEEEEERGRYGLVVHRIFESSTKIARETEGKAALKRNIKNKPFCF